MKRIAVLTSGGDAPGMNAAIRSIVRTAISNGMKCYGIKRGYNGLIEEDYIEMDMRSVSDILQRGGTVLYAARSPEFMTEEGQKKAVATCKKLKLDAVFAIGGDGTFRGTQCLSSYGIPCFCIPGTIDNDVSCTDTTIGFDTALNTAMEMVDKIRDTTQSHGKCSVIEVMGRGCGDIALVAGMAVGATIILIPEIPYDINRDIINRIKDMKKTGKKHFIVVIAEGVGDTEMIAAIIKKEAKMDTKITVLGHVQRGGSPTASDRYLATIFGYFAVQCFLEGKSNRVIAIKNYRVVDYDITEALKMKRKIYKKAWKANLEISI